MKPILPVLLAWCLCCFAAQADDQVSFNRDIRPILSDRCFFCHGPDDERREADLRLDREQAAKDYAIVPGEPDESELMARLLAEDPEERMPPAQSKLTVTPDEIDLIRRWIQQGAAWDDHWAFSTPTAPEVPAVEPASWPRNEIDHFVLDRLTANGLEPADRADRETLIRRVTFDLTGLPPTLDEIDAYVDDDAAGAWERVVDRLLASEAFGERMASDWLDVARYSDTYGYQVDRDRYVWPWRDWVVRAFNRNMPYDQFITWQLAGDLLPDATDDMILATTFNRLHPQKVEGGSVPEEFRIEYVADRTQTFGTAFLGLTLECCRCHDHKYDPFSQRNYYQFSAFFDNIDEAGLYSYFTPSIPTPTLMLANDATKQTLSELATKVAQAEQQLASVRAARRPAFETWLQHRSDESTAETDEGAQSRVPGQVAQLDFEQPPAAPNQSVEGPHGKAVKLTGDDAVPLKVGNFPRVQPFSVSLWMNTPDEKQRAVVFHRSRAWTDSGSRGYQLLIEDGCLSASLIHFWPGNAIRIKTVDKIPVQQWLHVTMTWDGSSRAAGLKLYLNGKPAPTEVVRDQLTKQITGGGGDNLAIGERFRDRGFTQGQVDEFRVFQRELTPIEAAEVHDGQSLQRLLATEAKALGEQNREQLFAYYLSTVDEAYRAELSRLQETRAEYAKAVDGVAEIMVMRESSEPRLTYLLLRGAYDRRSDEVQPETPGSLLAFPGDQPRNRLGLARWLTSPQHPLTSRVTVNRLWQLIFGSGLVRTPEDFGSQGQPPTHPELLDWLATDFVSHGWDLRRLIKQMVMSATYQQSSLATRELLTKDPENRLLARASSYRLPAEMLRDNALALSGLLVSRVGGPPARPYEVEVSFKPVKRDQNDGLYRRSLYTYWKRTGPAPVMMTLDAAKRDVCRVKRERTSSPLEAFVLLNGPQFVEAARVLSQSLIEKYGEDQSQILRDLFRLTSGRQPSTAELQVLVQLFDRQWEYFAEDPQRAQGYLQVGDHALPDSMDPARLAALASVANTMISYDECVNRR